MAPIGGDYDFFGGTAGPAQPTPPSGGTPSAPRPSGPPIAQFSGTSMGAPPAAGGFAQPASAAPLQGSWGTPSSGNRSRNAPSGKMIALGVVAAFAIVGLFAVQTFHVRERITLARTSVSIPTTAAGFTLAENVDQQRLENMFKGAVSDSNMNAPKIGVYKSDTAPLGALVVAVKFKKPFTKSTDDGGKAFASGLTKGSGGTFSEFNTIKAGKLGGTVQCTTGTIQGTPVRVCGSIDAAALVGMVFYDAKTPDSTVIAMRDAVEHR